MNIDAIVTKIAEEAKETASSSLENARSRAGEMERAASEEAQKAKIRVEQSAQDEAKLQRERMLRMAALQDRKDTLVMKRAVIDQAFEKALEKMNAMPAADARALSLALLASDARGDEEILFGPGDEAVYDQSFLEEANEALKKQGKPGTLTYAGERLPQRGGFVLRQGGMQMEMTWDMVLRVRRDALEADVANLLFA